jgi:serine/threonine-protein kinase HipA
MPIEQKDHDFDSFPPFFEGLLPEGEMLDGLLRQLKIDRKDYFTQLIAVGADTVGAVTVVEDGE